MDRSFQKSLTYSTVLHCLLLLLIYFIYHSFLIIQTPLLMDLTLVGKVPKGNDLGAPSAQTGENPAQMSKTENNPKTSDETVHQPKDNTSNPEVSMKKKVHAQNTPSPAHLESLHTSAPIGLENQKEVSDSIKTTAGLGHTGIAGSPEGKVDIQGDLAGRAIQHRVDPVYPEWAKKQGIEATLKYQITVLPNGLLREGDIQLEQTSGYRELDRVVYDALIQWEFSPLPAASLQVDQSGIATFAFSLKN